MGLCAFVMAFAPRPIIAAFLDVDAPANADVVALAASFLFVAAIFQLFDAAQSVGAGMLRGLHDTRWPMLIALVGYWMICLPLGAWLAFPAGLGGLGVWIGFVVALALVAAAVVGRWIVLTRPSPAGEPVSP
jgi:MATE family multidrug resistance protein